MIGETSRKLTIRDVMALIVATAIGIAAGRSHVVLDRLRSKVPPWWAMEVVGGSVWLAVALSLGLLVLRLLQPRPPLRRLAAQPGFIAGAAVLTTLALLLVETVENAGFVHVFHSGHLRPAMQIQRIGSLLPTCSVYAVSAAWITLALNGRWHPEANWLDRAGRLVGAFWIIYPTLFWATSVLQEVFN